MAAKARLSVLWWIAGTARFAMLLPRPSAAMRSPSPRAPSRRLALRFTLVLGCILSVIVVGVASLAIHLGRESHVEEKTRELRDANEHVLRAEKLASLGRMAAGVAHEMNNPLTGILTFAHLLLRKAPEGSQERKDLEVIVSETNRCARIVKELLTFARETPPDKLPGVLIPVAKVAHSNEAMMAFLVITVWHFYCAHLAPEVFPVDTSMFTGTIARARNEEEHPPEGEGACVDPSPGHVSSVGGTGRTGVPAGAATVPGGIPARG